MLDQRLICGLLVLITFVSTVRVEGAKGSNSMSVLQEDDEEVTVVPSIPSSSSSKRKSNSAKSNPYGYGSLDGNYYDYSPPTNAYAQLPYYTKYSSDVLPLPAYTRQQRYVNPDYLGDMAVGGSSVYNFQSQYAVPDSSGEPFPAASHSSGWHSTGGGGSGGGGSGQGHGHGWHHEKTHTNYKISAVNTDAIGLLGLLGLLSVLQGVLLLLTTTTTTTTAAAAMGRRRKRDVEESIEQEVVVDELTRLILPSLNVVAQARIGKLPMNCTQREICKTNQILVQKMSSELGKGRMASMKITEAIQRMIGEVDPSSSTAASIKTAATLGRNAEGPQTCDKYYPVCKELGANGAFGVPVLLPPSHPFYYNHERHE